MNTGSVELQRARRRYKALLRERESLASSGASDPVLENEIRKLEESHSELKSSVPERLPGNVPVTLAPVAPSAMRDVVEQPFSSSQQYASLSSRQHLEPPATNSSVQREESCLESLNTQHQAHRAPSRTVAKPLARFPGYLVIFFLQLFNESHQRSLLGRWSCAVIAVVSMIIALLQCTILDPSSTLGTNLTPLRFCCLVHAGNLASIYERASRPLSIAMLTVYVCCDLVPSLALTLVTYGSTSILLRLCGIQLVTFAC